MKRIFIDTNILIDFLGEGEKFYTDAAIIVSMADRKEISLLVSSLSFTTAAYILMKYNDHDLVIDKLQKFCSICTITNIGKNDIISALHSGFQDFEDAVQYFSAINNGADIIITRDKKGFKNSEISVLSAQEFLNG